MQDYPSKVATERFASGYNCAQSVLAAYAKSLQVDEQLAMKIAVGFGGGMGRMGGTCGAVSGAIMVLGLKIGTPSANRAVREQVYERVREFTQRFAARHGGLDCKTLLGADISSSDGYATAKDRDLFRTLCPCFVRGAIELLDELLSK